MNVKNMSEPVRRSVKPSKAAIDFAAAVRDWISSPHGPDEDLDLQLAELTQGHLEAMFEACRLYEDALESECHCDQAETHCPHCSKIEKARKLWDKFAERSAKLNPDWIECLENELSHTKEHRDAWLWAYSLLVSVIEGIRGWETAKTAYPIPQTEEILQFPAVEQAKGFRKSFEQMERRLHHLESIISAYIWLQSATYRVIMHRHTGTFRAIDEAQGLVWEADNLEELDNAIKTHTGTPLIK